MADHIDRKDMATQQLLPVSAEDNIPGTTATPTLMGIPLELRRKIYKLAFKNSRLDYRFSESCKNTPFAGTTVSLRTPIEERSLNQGPLFSVELPYASIRWVLRSGERGCFESAGEGHVCAQFKQSRQLATFVRA